MPGTPLVDEREKQKREVYKELAADLAKQNPGYTIILIPVVVGDQGIIGSLQAHLAIYNIAEESCSTKRSHCTS